ncbi:hypothetical protein EZS27_003883 [termite gut metagenome]|uniref:Uncharacterized protein n=1 Tax=termite gut metagenome TaxID=433724 RepID=A0A5J4STQ5_9ZZZZ
MNKQDGIIEIIGDVCSVVGEKAMARGIIGVIDGVNFDFGSTAYINRQLIELSQNPETNLKKFPLFGLHGSFFEDRTDAETMTKASVSMTIAVLTESKYTNKQRLEKSFIQQLRPLYNLFFECLRKERRIEKPYNEHFPHSYMEDYRLGSSGAMDSEGKTLIDLIDAINIYNLSLTVKKVNC